MLLALALGAAGGAAQTQAPMSTEDRQQYLDKLQQILPPVPSFDAWLCKEWH